MRKVLIFFISLIAFSCASSKNSNSQFDFEKTEFFFIQDKESLFFYFVVNSTTTNTNILEVDSITLSFVNKRTRIESRTPLQKIFFSNYKFSEKESKNLEVYHTLTTLLQLQTDNYEDIVVKPIIHSGKKKFTKEFQLKEIIYKPKFEKYEFLKLYPAVTEINDKEIQFSLLKIRIMPHSGEYLPSSESLKIEIYNQQSGKTINSSEGKNFMQVITNVEPRVVGQYSIDKVSMSINKQASIVGQNRVRFIIPAHPNNYFLETNYWIDK